jgi:hypothetical protein
MGAKARAFLDEPFGAFPDLLTWVREHERCAVWLCQAKHPDPAHVKAKGMGGHGVDRNNVIGLCHKHHRIMHDSRLAGPVGWERMQNDYGLDAVAEARAVTKRYEKARTMALLK